MSKKRRNHAPQFKAKVALAAIKGDETLSNLASRYDINANLIVKWKKQLLDSGNFQGSCTFSYAANNTSFCGFSATAPQGRQFRVWPDHRLGFAALAS